jgi:decaprenylphospho-beta-D-erythro-pentofuranosid-2-ulose 2-reductase
MNETVVVVGATSAIARALCHNLAAQSCRLILAGRRRDELDALAADLQIRYRQPMAVEPFDALDFDAFPGFVARCLQWSEGTPDSVVLCYGYYTDQVEAQSDAAKAQRIIHVNFTSAVLLLDRFAEYFERRGKGTIAAISSVAGDLGRQSNYTYGAAKSGLSTYLQGLRNRLYRSGVHVLTIKPGIVDTPMTHGLVNPRSALVSTPERVARDVARALRARRDVLYTPWFWRPILAVIRAVPERIFKMTRM